MRRPDGPDVAKSCYAADGFTYRSPLATVAGTARRRGGGVRSPWLPSGSPDWSQACCTQGRANPVGVPTTGQEPVGARKVRNVPRRSTTTTSPARRGAWLTAPSAKRVTGATRCQGAPGRPPLTRNSVPATRITSPNRIAASIHGSPSWLPWMLAAILFGLVILVAGTLFLVKGGRPGAPWQRVAPVTRFADGAVSQAPLRAGEVVVVDRRGTFRTFLAPTGSCPVVGTPTGFARPCVQQAWDQSEIGRA